MCKECGREILKKSNHYVILALPQVEKILALPLIDRVTLSKSFLLLGFSLPISSIRQLDLMIFKNPYRYLNCGINSAMRYPSSVQFSSVAQSCLTLWDPMNHSTPSLPVHHQLPEFTQTHVHRVTDAIQSSHPLSSPFLPAFNLSQPQGHFQWVCFSHQVGKILALQLQHQSFQWVFRTDFL